MENFEKKFDLAFLETEKRKKEKKKEKRGSEKKGGTERRGSERRERRGSEKGGALGLVGKLGDIRGGGEEEEGSYKEYCLREWCPGLVGLEVFFFYFIFFFF